MSDMPHFYMCDMSSSYVWPDLSTYVTCFICPCDLPNSHMRYDSFIRLTWFVHVCNITHDSYLRHAGFVCVARLIRGENYHMCNVTRSYLQHDLFLCVTHLILFCTLSCFWHYAFVFATCYLLFCVTLTCLIDVCGIILSCGMTHPYVQHASTLFATWLTHTTSPRTTPEVGEFWMSCSLFLGLCKNRGGVFLKQTQIFSRLQFTSHFLEFNVMETKLFRTNIPFVPRYPNVEESRIKVCSQLRYWQKEYRCGVATSN